MAAQYSKESLKTGPEAVEKTGGSGDENMEMMESVIKTADSVEKELERSGATSHPKRVPASFLTDSLLFFSKR